MSDARARMIRLELELELVWRLVLDGGVCVCTLVSTDESISCFLSIDARPTSRSDTIV